MKKLHESGDWQRAMEKAMSEAQGQREEVRRAMEEARRAMQDMPRSKEWKEAWAKAREEMRRALKAGKVTEGGKTRNMTPQERKTLQETLKSFEKTPDLKFEFKDLPLP